jgi:hypothetical protein
MFDEMSAYREILRAVHKKAGERLDGAAEGASFHLHSLLYSLSDELRKREVDVMRLLARMKKDGLFTSSGSPPLYTSSDQFEGAYRKIAEEMMCV